MSKDPVHVVVVTHGDRAHHLPLTLPAILATEWPLTLTVVANAPSVNSLAYLVELRPRLLRLIINPANRGYAVAANQGWQVRPAPLYTCHLGDDCLPLEPLWLEKLVRIVDDCPEVGIVGHSVEGSWPVREINGHRVQVQPSNIGGITLIPRRTWQVCGYYTETMGIYGEEDALYGYKVRKAGLLCCYWDDTGLGRSFAHLGDDKHDPDYRAWKNARRLEAIQARDKLILEYEAGRPLNS